ncbi:MAG: prepilin-type N-terminal cleavage/methylation domain-containing protein [Gammaproteobacteria bacterium]
MRVHQQGLSLVELVIAIVVIGIAAAALAAAYVTTVSRSSDPQIEAQATAIAQSYMDEILAHDFSDPDGSPADDASRSTYDDVSDYNGLPDNRVRDQNGNLVTALDNAGYTVSVAVAASNDLGIGSANTFRITVAVQHNGSAQVQLVGYRTNY